MTKKLLFLSVLLSAFTLVKAQSGSADSAMVRVHPAYDKVGHFHRKLFGENYRKEWAANVKLPVLHLSQLHGGLKVVKQGGGLQSQSLRLVDPTGTEWVLRTVEKVPDKVLPEELRETFVRDWLDDATSAQNPFGALVVPPLADALKIPHANPIIGVVAPDKNLEEYEKVFKNRVCLLEEREPGGESDNTPKMEEELAKDNDNHFKGKEFARARMLDVLIGDWDRHEDQWRWRDDKKGAGKLYEGVPRDRDQALYTNQGFFEHSASHRWILPTLQGFSSKIGDVRYSMFKTRFINPYPDAQFTYQEWMKLANGVKSDVTDSVIEAALRRLPKEIYKIRHDTLAKMFKARRDNLPAAMDEYYRFSHRIVDLRLSDKNERVLLTDDGDTLKVLVNKISKKDKVEDTLLNFSYKPEFTQEVRIFTGNGNDQVSINTKQTKIKVRVVGGGGDKQYDIASVSDQVKIYGTPSHHSFTGDSTLVKRTFNSDTATTAIHNTNLYNVWMPTATASINKDDGFLLGIGFRYTGQGGFRKFPYATQQDLMIIHSFTTQAFGVNYRGEWTHVIGNASFVMQAIIKAPDNTMNFFGRGNNSVYDQTKDYATYYRIRFNEMQFNPSLSWANPNGVTFSVGPSLYYYHLNPNDNVGRFINNTPLIGSYDSTTYNQDKLHVGAIIDLTTDKRNNKLLPTSGVYFNVRVQGYTGLNSYSKSYAQVIPEFRVYQRVDSAARVVLADRVGGGVTIGQTAFYQSLFLGGQGNLLGFRKNRFAGQHMAYNDFEVRLRLGNWSNYILPGEIGLSGFYDIGRVWEQGEQSDNWHQGQGGGIYFAPAKLTVLQLQAGHSIEGWYPEFSFEFRF